MSENLEKRDEVLSEEDQANVDAWLAKYAAEEIQPEKRRECGPEVEEVERMFEDLERTHDLEALSAITNIATLEEAQAHPTWMPAQRALWPIYEKFRVLKDETNITDEKYAELKAKWKRLTQAIGLINDGKLDQSPR